LCALPVQRLPDQTVCDERIMVVDIAMEV
jgi:hypothetical protein